MRKKLKIGSYLITTGFVILYFFGSFIGSYLVMNPLETRYSPLLQPELETAVIVVLGGGGTVSDKYPVTSKIGQSSLYRLTEGLRIHQKITNSRLILMGGSFTDNVFSSDNQINLLNEIAYNPDIVNNIQLLSGALNTEEEAILIKEIMMEKSDIPLVIVTSARHMPRAIALIKKNGLNPIPAPTHYTIMNNDSFSINHLKWDPDNLKRSHQAIHEYAGIIWSKIRGKL